MRRLAPDLGFALLLAVAAFVLYRGTFQARQFGDSSLLVAEFAAHSDGSGFWYHALYMPAAGLLGALLGRPSPPEVLRVLSSACGALGVACAYGLARGGWGAGRVAAGLAAALLALSPGYWFFATQIEVHTLQAACVGLCALVTLAVPWRRPVLASLLVAAVLPLLYLSHQSGMLLGPGFVLLAQHARVHAGQPPFRARTLLFAIGPLFLVGMLVGLPVAGWWGDLRGADLLSSVPATFKVYGRVQGGSNLVDGWIGPLGLLLPAALVGAIGGRVRGWALAAPLALVLPSAVFFVVWGLPERGGYTLGSSMFLAALAGAALTRPGRGAAARATLALGALALVLQGAWGWTSLRAYDKPEWRTELNERRQAIVQAIGERGAVISINAKFQYIEADLPGVTETSLVRELTRAISQKSSPDAFLEHARVRLDPLLSRTDVALALDRSYLALLGRVAPDALQYTDALESWLATRCRLEPVAGTDWPVLRLQRLPAAAAE